MRVSIIVLCHNRYALTERTLAAIRANTNRKHYCLIAVDDGSTDATCEKLRGNTNVDVVLTLPHVGICKAMNIALSMYRTDFMVKLDNDAMPMDPDWLTAMIETYEALPNAGCVGHHVTNKKHAMSNLAKVEGTPWAHRIGRHNMNGGCWGMGARTLEKVGMAHVFPAQYGFWDGQYCWRIKKAGLQLYYVFNPRWKGRSIQNIQPVEEKQGPYFKWKTDCRSKNFPQFNAMKRKPSYVPNTLWVDDEQPPPNRQWIWMGDHDDADVRQRADEEWPFVTGVFDKVENRR